MSEIRTQLRFPARSRADACGACRPAARARPILFWLGLTLALWALPATALTTGNIEGRILDIEEDRPLPGVTVTLEGPALPRPRTTLTDAGGRFHFRGLPSGTYELDAVRRGFVSLEQTGIRVEVGRTVTLIFETYSAFDDEEVIVTGSAPVLDETTASHGEVYELGLFDHVPVDRELRDLPHALEGTVPTATLDGAVSIAGGAPGDNVFRLDGLDVTHPVTGASGVSLPFEQVSRVEVSAGGRDAGHEGSFGGLVQLLTRSGGPRPHGRWSVHAQSRELTDAPPATPTSGRDLGTTAVDGGFALGGPAVAERLWYFVAATRRTEETRLDNRQGHRFDRERDIVAGTAKLTGQPGERHLLTATVFANPTDLDDEPLLDAVGRLGHDGDTGGEGWVVGYHGALGGKGSPLFLEVRGGRFEETFEARPLADVPLYEDLTLSAFRAAAADCGPAGLSGRGSALGPGVAFSTECVGGSVVREVGAGRRAEETAALTWIPTAGAEAILQHTWRFGVDRRRVEVRDDARFPGPAPGPFTDSTGRLLDPDGLTGQRWLITDEVARLFEIEGTGDRSLDEVALFVEDRVRLGDHVVLRLGLRAERMDADLRPAEIEGDGRAPGLVFHLGDTLAPRLSLVWDIRGNGRSRFFAHYGRYVDSRPSVVEGLSLSSRRWNVYTFAAPLDGPLPSAADPGELLDQRILARTVGVAQELEAPAVVETRFGVTLEPLPDFTLGVSAVLRELRKVVEDVSLDGGESYVLVNPGGSLTTDPVTGEALSSPVFFPRPRRDYRALQVRLDKGWGNAWQLHGSYTFAESEGNYGDAVPPPDGAVLTPDFDTRFDLPETIPVGDGLLVGDRRHQWRVYGSWQWASKLTTGLFGRYLSGASTARLGAHPLLGRRSRYLGPVDDGGRLPELWSLDLHLEYPLQVVGVTVDLLADLFNVTGREAPVRVVEEWTFLDPEPPAGLEPQTQDAFGTAVEHQRPRTVRLGLRVRW